MDKSKKKLTYMIGACTIVMIALVFGMIAVFGGTTTVKLLLVVCAAISGLLISEVIMNRITYKTFNLSVFIYALGVLVTGIICGGLVLGLNGVVACLGSFVAYCLLMTISSLLD